MGATLVATWYWLKVAADGSFATGAHPRSAHRKPWEPLLIGHVGGRSRGRAQSAGGGAQSVGGCHGAASSTKRSAPDTPTHELADDLAGELGLPRRQVIYSVPLAHSMKPPLDQLLKPCARALQEPPHVRARTGCGPTEAAMAAEGEAEEASWRRLPKMEMFAREMRPYWHSIGHEALLHQHESFLTSRAQMYNS